MKRSYQKQLCALALIAGSLCSSCSWLGLHTTGQLRKGTSKAYQQGQREGIAREARRAFHESQREAERPEQPPEIEYYKVPVPAHVSEDGVKIEGHTVTIPVVKN